MSFTVYFATQLREPKPTDASLFADRRSIGSRSSSSCPRSAPAGYLHSVQYTDKICTAHTCSRGMRQGCHSSGMHGRLQLVCLRNQYSILLPLILLGLRHLCNMLAARSSLRARCATTCAAPRARGQACPVTAKACTEQSAPSTLGSAQLASAPRWAAHAAAVVLSVVMASDPALAVGLESVDILPQSINTPEALAGMSVRSKARLDEAEATFQQSKCSVRRQVALHATVKCCTATPQARACIQLQCLIPCCMSSSLVRCRC